MDDLDDDTPQEFTNDIEIIYSDDENDQMVEDFSNEEGTYSDNQINEEVVDVARLTFTKHTRSVFSSELSKDMSLAVTGGEDDMAYVWSTSNGNILLECTGHKDSVTEASFNHDGQLVATGDMAGMIQVWNIKDKKLIWCHEGDDMDWLMWHPLANILITSHYGVIYVWQIPQGNCKVLPSHGSAANCGKVLPDGKQLLAGYEDGQIKLWDIKTSNIIWQLSEPLSAGVTMMDLNQDGSLLAVAPASQVFKVSDGKHVATFLMDNEKDTEVTLFNDELNVVVTGSLTGQLCVWDLNKNMLRHQAKIDSAVTILKFGPNGKLFVGSTDGSIYVCDVRTGTLLETLTGHQADVLSVCVSQDGKTVLSTSDDTTAKIFDVKC